MGPAQQMMRLGLFIIVLFGGVLGLKYYQTGEILLDQLLGLIIGVITAVAGWVWIKKEKPSSKEDE